jgi:hypothetical protein
MGVARQGPSWARFNSDLKTGLKHGFRSGLEQRNAKHLEAYGIPVVFEQVVIKYVIPTTERTYTPDFELPNGIIVETKGKFEPQDRAKHLFIKIAHPDLDIRFVFDKPHAPMSKGSKTTNASWAEKHGFKWANKLIPAQWWSEPPRPNLGRGPRTIPVPQAALDFFADSARQPHKPGRIKASGNT